MKYEELSPAVALVERPLPGGYDFTVRAALVRGARHRVAVDTLMVPADMAPFAGASLVVYTHSDWDHCWGTGAFPGVPVIGHRLTRERLTGPEVPAALEQMRAERPEAFAGAAIVPPEITFDQRLEIDAGAITLVLHHAPGHTADTVIVHLPEQELLLAGDWAEDPLPALNEVGHIRAWADSLRRWSGAGLRTVVPGHGRVSGPELIARNLDYMEELIGEATAGLAAGLTEPEIAARLPLERFLPDPQRYPPFYPRTHAANIRAVLAELQGAESV